MPESEVTVWTDGASRGNPGPAAAAFIIAHDGVEVIEYAEPIGIATNNVAEYTAMIRALQCCAQLKIERVYLHSDSELMVKQMLGEYRVKHPDMIPLYEEAQELVEKFRHVEFTYIPRAQNKGADKLGNQALDGKPSPLPPLDGFRFTSTTAKTTVPDVAPDPDADVIAILQMAENSWSSGAATPTPAEVWAELRSLLMRQKRLSDSAQEKPSSSRGRARK